MNKEKKQLKKINVKLTKLYTERDKINNKLKEKEQPKFFKNIGKCYVFQNSYGGNEAKWPFYVKILDYKDETYVVFTFQTTNIGHKDIQVREHYIDVISNPDYKEISKEIFDTAWKAMLQQMKKKGLDFES